MNTSQLCEWHLLYKTNRKHKCECVIEDDILVYYDPLQVRLSPVWHISVPVCLGLFSHTPFLTLYQDQMGSTFLGFITRHWWCTLSTKCCKTNVTYHYKTWKNVTRYPFFSCIISMMRNLWGLHQMPFGSKKMINENSDHLYCRN